MNETLAIRQTKFSNGEISPSMYGDVSHPKYPASVRTCLNWLPTPQGALVKRPGFKFIAPVKDATYAPRLIKFVFSDSQTFVLEFGNTYIRFYQNGKYVGVDGNLHTYGDSYAGGYYELATPFTTAMLPYLKYSQVGNTITICYGGQVAGVAALAPRDLTHTSGALTPWAIAATPLAGSTYLGGSMFFTGPSGSPHTLQTLLLAWSNATTYHLGDQVFSGNAQWVSIQDPNLNNAPPVPTLNAAQTGLQGNLYWAPSADTAHSGASWAWAQTWVLQRNSDGVVFESAPQPYPVIMTNVILAPDRPVVLRLADSSVPPGYTAIGIRMYRAINPYNVGNTQNAVGVFGLIDDLPITGGFNVNYTDKGAAPDYTRQPPKNTDPFYLNGADSYPSVIGYLDQRRLWASSALLPASLWLSRIGDLYNYDGRNVPGLDSDAMLNVTLSSEELEQIRSFVPMRRGLLLTSQGEWAMSGQGGGPVSRSSLDVKRQSRWGANWLNPLVIGTGVLFNTAKSNMVRDLYPLYGLYADIWDGQDLSVMARHLMDLHTIKAWDYQSVPFSVAWMVRDDGVLLSLTYQHAPPSYGQQLSEGIVAWARHTTGIGSDTFESVCVVPEPPDDAVYVVARRLVNGAYVRGIERMENPICPQSPYAPGVSDVRYGKYLDCAVAYDGHNDALGFSATAALIDSVGNPGSANPADYSIGKQIKITAAGFVAGDAANPYGSAFVLDPESVLGLGPVNAHIVGYTDATHVVAELDTAMTQAQVTAWRAGRSGAGAWAIAKGQITHNYLSGYGLDTLDAPAGPRGVICLADGDVQLPAAWNAGVASLQIPAVVIQLGISYSADLSLLDAMSPSAEIRNKFKNLIKLGFELAGTRDLWVGKDFANLSQWQQRQVSDSYGVLGLATGYFETRVTGDYNKLGQAVARHFEPLPAILTSVLREFRLGDS